LIDRQKKEALYDKPSREYLISFLKANPNYYKLSEYLISEHPVIAIDYAANHFITDLLPRFAKFSGGSFLDALQLIHFRWEVDLVNLIFRWFLDSTRASLEPILIPFDFFPYNEFLAGSRNKNMKDFIQLLRKSSSPLLEVVLKLNSTTKFDSITQIDSLFKHFYFNYFLSNMGTLGVYSGYYRVLKDFISLEIEKFNIKSIVTLLDHMIQDNNNLFINIESILYSHKNIDGKKVNYYFRNDNPSALIRMCNDSAFKQVFSNIKTLSDYEKNRILISTNIERIFFSQLLSQSKFFDNNIKETVMKLALAYYFSAVLEAENIKVLNHGIDASLAKYEIKNLVID
jgi:hypothetical protein